MKRKIVAITATAIVVASILIAYVLIGRVDSKTTLASDPEVTSVVVGGNFTVTIRVTNVANLYGWQLKLKWNTTILNVGEVAESTFLRSGGETFFASKSNNTEGKIVLDCTLLGNVSGVTGNGPLATIRFSARSAGGCDLVLYDSILLDSSEETITHLTKDAHLTVSAP